MATSGISDPSSGGANWHNMSPGDGVQTQSLDETSATNGLGNTAGADGKNLDDVAPVKSPKGNAGLLADANGAPRIDGLTVSFSEDDMVLALAALQMKMMDGQIKTAQKSLEGNKLQLTVKQEESLKKIADAVEKCKQAQAKRKCNSILGWFKKAIAFVGAVVGAVVAVAAAVASGGAAIPLAALACVMAFNAAVSLIKDIASAAGKNPAWLDKLATYSNPTGVLGMGMAKLGESLGMSKDKAQLFGTISSTLIMLGVTITLAVMSGGTSAGTAFKDLSNLGKLAQLGSTFGTAVTSGVSGGMEIGSGVLNIQIAKLTRDEERLQADRKEIAAMVTKLLKKMEEDQDDIKKVVNEIMESLQQVSTIIDTAAKARTQIAANLGGGRGPMA